MSTGAAFFDSCVGAYRYGFNGKEKDTQGEWGSSTVYDFGARVYNPGIAKFLSVDPLAIERSWMTPYNFVQNNPINRVDPTGALDSFFYMNYLNGEVRTSHNRMMGPINTYILHNGLDTEDPNYVSFSFNDNDIQASRDREADARLRALPAQGTIQSTSSPIELPFEFGPKAIAKLGTGTFALLGLFSRRGVDDGILYTVGSYRDLQKLARGTGLDGHHVGQAKLMEKFIPNYVYRDAPAILVNRLGHRFRFGQPVLSRSSAGGITSARQLVARDILELRRVYPEIPNEALNALINLNKAMYPKAFKKK